jgi:hypothetical protein
LRLIKKWEHARPPNPSKKEKGNLDWINLVQDRALWGPFLK